MASGHGEATHSYASGLAKYCRDDGAGSLRLSRVARSRTCERVGQAPLNSAGHIFLSALLCEWGTQGDTPTIEGYRHHCIRRYIG